MSQTFSNALDDLRSEASAAASGARRDVGHVARELPYAVVGSVSVGIRRSRKILEGIAAGPSRTLERLRSAPKDLRSAYWERVGAGHDALDRVRGRKGVRSARSATRSARSATRAASTSVGRAARATARAVSDATDALDPGDNRPYEERTVEELYALASEREIEGRSQMTKGQLIRALRSRSRRS